MPPAQHRKYSQTDLLKAIEKVQRGKLIRQVAKETGIPYTTIQNHVNGKQGTHLTTFGPEKSLTEDEESNIEKYTIFMAERGFPLTRKVLKSIVKHILKRSKRHTLIDRERGPSQKWVRKFLKRHPDIASRTPDNLERARAEVTQTQIDNYFVLLSNTVKRLGIENMPSRIFNCDETGFSGKERFTGKVLVKRGSKHAYQQTVKFTGHTTVHVAASADGRVLPPFIIYQSCLPRSVDGVPDFWTMAASEKGYITSELFLNWFRDVFVPHCGNARPVLLVMDNHVSHLSFEVIDLAQKENIELLCLPPKSTHLLQPLDKGYFNLLKSEMADVSMRLGYTGAKLVPREKFPKVLQYAMSNIAPSKVVASFRGTGLYPIDTTTVKNPVQINEEDPSLSVVESSNEEELCSQCGRSYENPLVKMGVIDAALADVFAPPPRNDEVKPSKRKRIEGARVITVGEINKPDEGKTNRKVTKKLKQRKIENQNNDEKSPKEVESEEIKQNQSKSKQASKRSKSKKAMMVEENVGSIVIEPEEVYADTETLCEICMLGNVLGFHWYGCDGCPAWYHYECLPHTQQVLLDLSIITNGAEMWFCNSCAQILEE